MMLLNMQILGYSIINIRSTGLVLPIAFATVLGMGLSLYAASSYIHAKRFKRHPIQFAIGGFILASFAGMFSNSIAWKLL